MLVGLTRITTHHTMTARERIAPLRAHRMRAILNHSDPSRVANRHQTIHVTHVAAHVAQHQYIREIGFCLQIIQIYRKVAGHAHKYWHAADSSNRSGHRG